MSRLFLALTICSLTLTVSERQRGGACELRDGYKDAFTVEVGTNVKGVCKFFISDFMGRKVINANIELKATSNKAVHVQYYVAFFDRDGKLIGCAGQGNNDEDGVVPGKPMAFGSCLIPLPLGFHEQIVQYKISLYEDDRPIGNTRNQAPVNTARKVADPQH